MLPNFAPQMRTALSRLVGQSFDQFDLLLAERSYRAANQNENANDFAVSQKRHTKTGAKIARVIVAAGEARFRLNVGDMNRSALLHDPARDFSGVVTSDRVASEELLLFFRAATHCSQLEHFAVGAPDRGRIGLAELHRRFQE